MIYIRVVQHINHMKTETTTALRLVSRIVCLGQLVAGKLFDAKVVKMLIKPIYRLPWDTWSSPSWPVCVNIVQLADHEQLYYELGSLRRQDFIKSTGCSFHVSIWNLSWLAPQLRQLMNLFMDFNLDLLNQNILRRRKYFCMT